MEETELDILDSESEELLMNLALTSDTRLQPTMNPAAFESLRVFKDIFFRSFVSVNVLSINVGFVVRSSSIDVYNFYQDFFLLDNQDKYKCISVHQQIIDRKWTSNIVESSAALI